VTSITMCVTCSAALWMLHSRTSCCSIPWKPLLDHRSDWNSCWNFFIPHLSFFRFSTVILTFTFILLMSQLPTQWLMTSWIRSFTKYVMPTDNLCFYYTQIWLENMALVAGSNMICWYYSAVLTFLITLYVEVGVEPLGDLDCLNLNTWGDTDTFCLQ